MFIRSFIALLVAATVGTTSPAQAAVHPRLLLDGPTLTDLRASAAANSPEWLALRKVCNGYHGVNRPDGEAYPDGGRLGAGYQGDGYYPAVYALGLCYQVTRSARYGKLGVKLVSAMATEGKHAAKPNTDDVYGIRNYGIGLDIGYDWFYDRLTPKTRARVGRVVRRWVRTYQKKGFGHEFVQGNYYAGYYATVGLAALGLDKKAPLTWDQFLAKIQAPVAQYYQANLAGGGWPEGWNYGPIATFNMDLPVLAARTARGADLTQGWSWPLTTGKYLVNFTWPGRDTLENSGAVYASENPTAAPQWLYTAQSAVLEAAGDPYAPTLRGYAQSVPAGDSALGPAWPAWIDFLYDRGQPTAAPTDLSYFAPGEDAAAVRSSWDANATWGSLIGGPYTNNPDNGEEYFDKGALTIVNGSTPFVVNAGAELQRDTPGTDDGEPYGEKIYSELFDDNAPRGIFNVFYTAKGGQGERLRADGAKTRMSAFEDKGSYVYLRADDLQDEYGDDVKNWSREVVYLRPGTFVVHDHTTVADGSEKQWLAWQLGGEPKAAGNGVFDVKGGRVITFDRATTVKNLFGSGKVFTLSLDGTGSADQDWYTVLDTDGSTTAETVPGGVAVHHGGRTTTVTFGASGPTVSGA